MAEREVTDLKIPAAHEADLHAMAVPVSAKPPPVEVSVVIPVHDEKDCLPALWNRIRPVLESLGRSFEVVFVDDGSKDGSLDILSKIRATSRSVRVLSLRERRGQSAALAAGFRAARGAWILTLDADLQNPPEEIPHLFAATADVDMVYGRRRRRNDSPLKKLSSRIGNSTRNLITGHTVRDTGCSLKLFRRDGLARIPLFQGMHRFLPTLFAFHGLRIREVDVDHHPRAGGRTKYGVLNRAWRGLLDCLGVRWLRGRSIRYDARETGDPR